MVTSYTVCFCESLLTFSCLYINMRSDTSAPLSAESWRLRALMSLADCGFCKRCLSSSWPAHPLPLQYTPPVILWDPLYHPPFFQSHLHFRRKEINYILWLQGFLLLSASCRWGSLKSAWDQVLEPGESMPATSNITQYKYGANVAARISITLCQAEAHFETTSSADTV